jgi:hypothetical protein
MAEFLSSSLLAGWPRPEEVGAAMGWRTLQLPIPAIRYKMKTARQCKLASRKPTNPNHVATNHSLANTQTHIHAGAGVPGV